MSRERQACCSTSTSRRRAHLGEQPTVPFQYVTVPFNMYVARKTQACCSTNTSSRRARLGEKPTVFHSICYCYIQDVTVLLFLSICYCRIEYATAPSSMWSNSLLLYAHYSTGPLKRHEMYTVPALKHKTEILAQASTRLRSSESVCSTLISI